MDIVNQSVDDFVVTSSNQSPESVATALAEADAQLNAPPRDPDAPKTPAAAPPDATPPASEEGEAAPVEEPETPASEPPPAAADSEVAAAAAKLPKGDSKAGKTLSDRARVIQAEIHQLTYQKAQSRQEAEAARLELEQLRTERERIQQELTARATPAPPPAPEKPKAEQFDTFEAYSDALGQYYRDEAKRDAVAEAQKLVADTLAQLQAQEAQRAAQAAFDQVVQQHNANIEAARAAHPDFDEVVTGSALPTNPMMDTHIPRSAVSGELLHYLATHPDECRTIAALPAGPTLVALGRLEARIEAVKSGPAPVRTPPVVSKAKAPIKPVGASGGIADEAPDAVSSSLDEHVRYWNPRDRRGGGRR